MEVNLEEGMNKKVFSYIVLAIAVLLITYVFITFQSKEIGTEKGNIIPDFTSPVWNTEKYTGSLSDYKGNVMVVNLWATWCENCKEEMPALMKFHEDYKKEGITVLAVNMTRYELAPREENVKNFVKVMNLTMPIFYNHDDEFYQTYKPLGLPTTYIVDKEGIIREVITGEVTYELLEELALPLAKK